MSKRRVTKQQAARIDKQHQSYRHRQETTDDAGTAEGLVIARYSRHAHIEDDMGHNIRCSIRPSIDSLVAGDRVVWQEEGIHQGVILSRYPRRSILGRPDQQGQLKPIAANITQIIIVIAPVPDISWELLDSYLVMAENLQLPAFILLNKTDLPCDDIQQTLFKYYEPLGYPLLFTNKVVQDNKLFLKALNQQISVFVGQSGVGKSSIIARILPHESSRIQTGEVSEHTQLGCHTTSNSHLYHIPSGGSLIDSPGIRELSLWNMSITDIAKGYREFRTYINQCKFRNCSHIDTPGCAVINATKNKLISQKRYENYGKIARAYEKN